MPLVCVLLKVRDSQAPVFTCEQSRVKPGVGKRKGMGDKPGADFPHAAVFCMELGDVQES